MADSESRHANASNARFYWAVIWRHMLLGPACGAVIPLMFAPVIVTGFGEWRGWQQAIWAIVSSAYLVGVTPALLTGAVLAYRARRSRTYTGIAAGLTGAFCTVLVAALFVLVHGFIQGFPPRSGIVYFIIVALLICPIGSFAAAMVRSSLIWRGWLSEE